MAKTRPVLHHDAGVSLYGPTPSYSRFRLVWSDPLTGTRPNRSYHDRVSAEAAFNQTVEYVKGARTVVPPLATTRRRSAPTVDQLFDEVQKRWRQKNRNARYIEKRTGLYRTWMQPTCGSLTVLDWGSSDEHCLAVLAAAREAGRSAATIQNIGALLRLMVTTAHARRLLPRTLDPMDDVLYVAGRVADDEAAQYIPPSDRPTTEMVASLAAEFARRGDMDGLPWLPLMVYVAAFGGLRLGELTALRASDVETDDEVGVALTVKRAWSYTVEAGFELKPPKNGRRRRVLLPASLRASLVQRAEEVTAAVGGDGLLFPGPKGPGAVFTEGELRRVFERCARDAGWACRPDGRTPKGQVTRGRPVIPWRNLRHHAATWLHDVAEFDWADVSRTLGHASVAFTQARYVRPGADAERRNVARLASL
jgi:integrase